MNLDQMSRYIETLRTLATINPRRIREAAGIDQAEMGRRIGVSASGVSRLEAGNRKPSPNVADAWLKALTDLMCEKQPRQRAAA
jgi:transcriptional regulator with XRE-family HTH domain